jgi:hypothetical protein
MEIIKEHPLKGRKQTIDHIAKRTLAIRESGRYDRLGTETLKRNKERTGILHTEEHKNKISLSMIGKRNSAGVKRSLEFRQQLSEYWKDNPDHNHWIDGKGSERNSEREKAMGRLEYRIWRESVFERDSYTCLFCGQIGGKLRADHIKPYSLFPDLRYDIDNGRTLCQTCHVKTDTYGGKVNNKSWEEVPI